MNRHLALIALAACSSGPSEDTVRGYVSGKPIDLAAGSTIGGAGVTPALTKDQVRGYVTADAIDLHASSTMGGAALATMADLPTTAAIRTAVTGASIDLAAGSTIAGAAPQARVAGTCVPGSAMSAVAPDGNVICTSFAVPNVVTVAPPATLTATLAGITGASTTNRFAVRVAPGSYTETVNVPRYISLIGDDAMTVVINGTVTLNGDSALKNVTVIGPGAGFTVRSQGAANALRDVTIANSLTSTAMGNSASALQVQSATTLEHCQLQTATALAGTIIDGIDLRAAVTVTVRDSAITVSGPLASAIDVTTAGDGYAIDVWNSELIAPASSGRSLYLRDRGDITVRGSKLQGENYVYQQNGNASTVLIATSQLYGIRSFVTATCAGNYDGTFAPLGSTCP